MLLAESASCHLCRRRAAADGNRRTRRWRSRTPIRKSIPCPLWKSPLRQYRCGYSRVPGEPLRRVASRVRRPLHSRLACLTGTVSKSCRFIETPGRRKSSVETMPQRSRHLRNPSAHSERACKAVVLARSRWARPAPRHHPAR